MPELITQEPLTKCVLYQKVSLVYGDEFLIDNSHSVQPSRGVWDSIKTADQKYPHSPERIWFLHTTSVCEKGLQITISELPEGPTPFTQAGLLDKEEEQLQELILRIRTTMSISYREILANRLVKLMHIAKEEDPSSIGISVGSLRHFYNFLQSTTTLKYPTISLTPEYDIYAKWKGEKNTLFSVHFLPNGDARFVIFKPNDKHPEQTVRFSGYITADIIIETVSPHSIMEWISK
jgi:hypothetical protein